MRRKEREITDVKKIEEILAGARYMHLGLFDGEYPYVVPLHYGYKMKDGKLTFYMHCAKEGHKIDCLRSNNHVFVEIDRGEALIYADKPCAFGAEYESVMCRGKAMILDEGAEKREALINLMKIQTGQDYEIDEKMAAAVNVIKVGVESYTAKACTRRGDL